MKQLFKSTVEVILASGSPRRRAYLEGLGIAFRVIAADITETVLAEESPAQYVERMAREKAESVGGNYLDRWVVAADTVVCFDDMILGKPIDENDAVKTLLRLSGQEHVVHTGVCLLNKALNVCDIRVVSSRVIFRDYSEDVIRAYVNSGEPMDKAGSYGIQGKGAFLVREIHGSYSNIVGLPLGEFIEMLAQRKMIVC